MAVPRLQLLLNFLFAGFLLALGVVIILYVDDNAPDSHMEMFVRVGGYILAISSGLLVVSQFVGQRTK
jgi:formate/nitrite transporter FocA (FNT family)